MNKDKIIEWLKAHWKDVLIGVLILFLICGIYYEYKKHEAIPMVTIQSNTIEEDTKAINELGIQDQVIPKELKNSIDKAVQSAPQKVFIVATQKEADTQANKIAKADKADAIIKQTEPAKQPASGNNSGSTSNEGIVNNYYGLHLEKNNKIKAGVTVLDSQTYENIAYQHKKDELIIHMQLDKSQPVRGFTYMRTVHEW
jgi:hypothetical protein